MRKPVAISRNSNSFGGFRQPEIKEFARAYGFWDEFHKKRAECVKSERREFDRRECPVRVFLWLAQREGILAKIDGRTEYDERFKLLFEEQFGDEAVSQDSEGRVGQECESLSGPIEADRQVGQAEDGEKQLKAGSAPKAVKKKRGRPRKTGKKQFEPDFRSMSDDEITAYLSPKSAGNRESLQWAMENAKNPAPDLKSCPSLLAWTMRAALKGAENRDLLGVMKSLLEKDSALSAEVKFADMGQDIAFDLEQIEKHMARAGV